MIGAKLYKSNMPGSDSMADALLSEKYEKRAKLRAKSEESYQALVDKETQNAVLQDQKSRPTQGNTLAQDNSQQIVTTSHTQIVSPDSEAKRDSHGKPRGNKLG